MEQPMTSIVSRGGRVVIPQELRESLGLKVGERVIFSRDKEGVRILTLDQAIVQAQALVEQAIPANINLQEDLRRMRDDDFARERHDS